MTIQPPAHIARLTQFLLIWAIIALLRGDAPARDLRPAAAPAGGQPVAHVVELLLRPTVDAVLNLFGRTPRLVSTDQRIGSFDLDYVDPEFWAPDKLMAWQDRENNIWLCQLNPANGTLLPPDGRGQKLGTAAPIIGADEQRILNVINGPEWGLSQRGLGVYFLSVAENQNIFAMRVSVPDGVQERLTPLDLNTTIAVMPSADSGDAQSRLLYARPSGTARPDRFWQEETDSDTAHLFPNVTIGSTGPRWIPNERAVVTNVLDDDDVVQIARYDIDDDRTTLLTAGPGKKVDGFFFHAPDFGNESQFICLVDSMQIDIFRQIDGAWTSYRTITAPRTPLLGEQLSVASAEPFIYRGKSYVIYLASNLFQSAVCIASADGTVNGIISAPSPLHKLDPEAVVLNDQLWVYYWINETEHAELHACRVQIAP